MLIGTEGLKVDFAVMDDARLDSRIGMQRGLRGRRQVHFDRGGNHRSSSGVYSVNRQSANRKGTLTDGVLDTVPSFAHTVNQDATSILETDRVGEAGRCYQ